MKGKIIKLNPKKKQTGYAKVCNNPKCAKQYTANRNHSKYCSVKCRSAVYYAKSKSKTKKSIKINYEKMTFILSVIGFIGSICFYFGVLRKVYADFSKPETKVEQVVPVPQFENVTPQILSQ